MDEGLYQFAQQYQRNASDPKTLYDYYGYVLERMDEGNRLDTARFEGIEEGKVIGREDGIISVAKGLLADGDSIDKIIKVTGLAREAVENLRDAF